MGTANSPPIPGLTKATNFLGQLGVAHALRRSGARLPGLSQPRNYESQKPLGVAILRFSAGGNTRGAVGRIEGAVVSFPLARVSGRGAGVGFTQGRARTEERQSRVGVGTRALCDRGTAPQCLGLLRNSTLMIYL